MLFCKHECETPGRFVTIWQGMPSKQRTHQYVFTLFFPSRAEPEWQGRKDQEQHCRDDIAAPHPFLDAVGLFHLETDCRQNGRYSARGYRD